MHERAFTLTTARFNSTEAKPNFINERCFGEDFAAWLAERLAAFGLPVAQTFQEDWGWCLVVPLGGNNFTVALGIMDESIGQVPAQWRVAVSWERGMNGLGSLFKSVPYPLLDDLCDKLYRILLDEPAFAGVEAL